MKEKFNNYKFNIFKIKNEEILKNKFNKKYIEDYIKNENNYYYKYECFYNKYYKKFFYYNKKREEYNKFYESLRFKENNKYLLNDIKENKYKLKLNKIEKIENFIKRNINFNVLKKYTIIKIDNNYYIIEKTKLL